MYKLYCHYKEPNPILRTVEGNTTYLGEFTTIQGALNELSHWANINVEGWYFTIDCDKVEYD